MSWVTSHYVYDGSGNVRQLFDNAGAVTDSFDYDAFGNLIARTGTTANSYLYRGEQFDADLGFYFLRARYYGQQRGRFWTMDPYAGLICKPHTLHKYLYVGADPVNNSDPSGLMQLSDSALNEILIILTAAALTVLSIRMICTAFKAASIIHPGFVATLPPLIQAICFRAPDGGGGGGFKCYLKERTEILCKYTCFNPSSELSFPHFGEPCPAIYP